MSRHLRWPRLLLAAALCFAFAAPALAQQSDMDPLAKKFAAKLKTGPARAIVSGFTDNQQRRSPLGLRLAGEFAAALLRFAPGLEMVPPDEYSRVRKVELWTESEARDFHVVRSLSTQMGVRLLITGSYEWDVTGLRVRVQAFDFHKNREVATAAATIALTPEREHLEKQTFALRHREKDPVTEKPAAGDSAPAFQPGREGVSYPVCWRCPDAALTPQARKEKYVGRVLLRIVVSPKGRAENIRVVHGAKFGLTESAMQAVAKWQYRPAKDRNGIPVPVEITVEVPFRLK